MAEIKPCPFCSSVNLSIKRDSEVEWYFVICHSCGTEGPFKNGSIAYSYKESAIKAWNRRSNDGERKEFGEGGKNSN